MPVVQVYLYKGRSKEVKKELVRRISQDFQEVANISPESLHILFHDVERVGRVIFGNECCGRSNA